MGEPANRELNEMGVRIGAWARADPAWGPAYQTEDSWWRHIDLPPWPAIMDAFVPAMLRELGARGQLTMIVGTADNTGEPATYAGFLQFAAEYDHGVSRRAILVASWRALNDG